MNLQNKQFSELLNEAILWIKKHRETMISIAAVTAVVIAFAVYFIVHYFDVRKEAEGKLSFGQIYAMNNANDRALGLFDDIINNYGNTQSAIYAKLFKADLLLRTNNFVESLKLYNDITANNKPENILVFAYIGAGTCSESLGNYNDAIRMYSEALQKYPEHYYAPRIYESLARSYEMSGLFMQTKDIYEKLITLYPGTYYAKKAQEKIGEMQKLVNPQQKEQK